MLMLDDLVESFGFLDQNQRAQDWLRDQGVSRFARIEWPGPIGIARIQTYRDGLFEFNDDGIKAYLMPVLAGGRCSDVIDILAFRPADPTIWWLHQGMVSILGDVTELDPDRPARIYATPLDYFAADGAGLVILDELGAAPLLRMLTDEDGPGVRFPTDAYDDARELEELLVGRPRPRLMIYIEEPEKELVE